MQIKAGSAVCRQCSACNTVFVAERGVRQARHALCAVKARAKSYQLSDSAAPTTIEALFAIMPGGAISLAIELVRRGRGGEIVSVLTIDELRRSARHVLGELRSVQPRK